MLSNAHILLVESSICLRRIAVMMKDLFVWLGSTNSLNESMQFCVLHSFDVCFLQINKLALLISYFFHFFR